MVFITAEIGINHNGSIDIAKKLIDVASIAGCDAIKFQKRTIEKVYPKEVLDSARESPWGTTTREQKNGLEFSLKQYEILNKYCKYKKINWFASCWDIESQKSLRKLCDEAWCSIQHHRRFFHTIATEPLGFPLT